MHAPRKRPSKASVTATYLPAWLGCLQNGAASSDPCRCYSYTHPLHLSASGFLLSCSLQTAHATEISFSECVWQLSTAPRCSCAHCTLCAAILLSLSCSKLVETLLRKSQPVPDATKSVWLHKHVDFCMIQWHLRMHAPNPKALQVWYHGAA